jgi:hypothetical protein
VKYCGVYSITGLARGTKTEALNKKLTLSLFLLNLRFVIFDCLKGKKPKNK